MKRVRIIILSMSTVILVLVVAQVVVSNSLSTTGEDLGAMQSQIATLKRENTILSERILTLSSLDHVASLAATDGFVISGTPIVVSAPLPLALNR